LKFPLSSKFNRVRNLCLKNASFNNIYFNQLLGAGFISSNNDLFRLYTKLAGI